jgi:hypothetical protein
MLTGMMGQGLASFELQSGMLHGPVKWDTELVILNSDWDGDLFLTINARPESTSRSRDWYCDRIDSRTLKLVQRIQVPVGNAVSGR